MRTTDEQCTFTMRKTRPANRVRSFPFLNDINYRSMYVSEALKYSGMDTLHIIKTLYYTSKIYLIPLLIKCSVNGTINSDKLRKYKSGKYRMPTELTYYDYELNGKGYRLDFRYDWLYKDNKEEVRYDYKKDNIRSFLQKRES